MIETVTKDNLSELLPLIKGYMAFYQVSDISDERNADFFSQFGQDNPLGCQFAYRDKGQFIGFATVYFSFDSTIPAKIATMHDLFCLESCRGKGVGRQLIEHCKAYATKKGAEKLQWMTAEDNISAQKLYDKITNDKSAWYFYNY